MSDSKELAKAAAKPGEVIRQVLHNMQSEFATALPRHIPTDRFLRVVMTAINQNGDLVQADKTSLYAAVMRAAQDGLLPDGKEGAFVIFNTKVKVGDKDTWVKAVQWMPMVYGIIKKMRNSGELASITAHAVFEKDSFEYVLGDDERIEHNPYLGEEDAGKVIAAYAIARLKDGTVQRAVLPRSQIEKIRSVSRAKDSGPWKDWYDEMAKKSAVRRLSKMLPMSTEIEDLLRREDVDSVLNDTGEPTTIENTPPAALPGKGLDALEQQIGADAKEPAEAA